MQTMEEYRNPRSLFLWFSEGLYVLDTSYTEEGIFKIRILQEYQNYRILSLQTNLKRLYLKTGCSNTYFHIKLYLIKFFMSSAKKASKTFQQIQYLKNDMLLFGRLYITNQLREGDLDVFFFSHKKSITAFLIIQRQQYKTSKKKKKRFLNQLYREI